MLVMKTLRVTIIIGLSTLLLTGCWGRRVSLEPISFDAFSIGIPAWFESVSAWLVENRQITNRVVRAFRINDPTWFDQNIVITRSTIRPWLSFDDFAAANTQRMMRELVWFQPGRKELIKLPCESAPHQTLEWILHSFVVTDTFFGQSPQYYIHQFQFVTEDSGYIISFATDQEKQEKPIPNYGKIIRV
jgi:hypothetical protein